MWANLSSKLTGIILNVISAHTLAVKDILQYHSNLYYPETFEADSVTGLVYQWQFKTWTPVLPTGGYEWRQVQKIISMGFYRSWMRPPGSRTKLDLSFFHKKLPFLVFRLNWSGGESVWCWKRAIIKNINLKGGHPLKQQLLLSNFKTLSRKPISFFDDHFSFQRKLLNVADGRINWH